MASGLRLPLQIGTSSLKGFVRAACSVVPGLLLMGCVLGPIAMEPWDEAVSTYADSWFVFVVGPVVGYLLIHYGTKHFFLAIAERPSDLVLGEAGIRVEGGRQSGLTIAWDAIEECKVEASHDGDLELVDSEKDKANFWKLVVTLHDGRRIVLATAEDPREQKSFEALRDSIRASFGEPKGDAPFRGAGLPAGTVVLRCGACGAPVGLVDASRVPCAFCHAPIDVPDDLRARFRAVLQRAASRTSEGTLLKKLLRQPGALRTNLTLGLAAVPMLLAWPLAASVGVVLYVLCYLHLFDGALLSLASFAVVFAFFYLVRGQLTDRQALRLLTLEFAARAPERPGAPSRCRQCDAPLSETPGSVLVHCPYCDTDNVLGIDPRGEARMAKQQVASLATALEERNRERRRLRGGAVVALGLLGGAWVLVVATLRPAHTLQIAANASDLERISYDPLDEFNPQISPDGKTLLYDLRAPERHGEDSRDEAIMTMGSGGGFRGTELTRETLHAIRPMWLPSGGGFVFVAWPSGKSASLWRVDSLTPYAHPLQLTTGGYAIGVPNVSADGRRVVYAGQRVKKGAWSVVTASTLAPGETSQSLASGFNPVFSPDGKFIYYSHTVSSTVELFIVPSAGGAPRRLTNGSCDLEDPRFSPDGTRMVVLQHCPDDAKDAWALFSMYPDGSHMQRMTSGDVEIETPSWHGDYLYFAANVAGNFDIWRVRLQGDLAGHGHPPAHLKM